MHNPSTLAVASRSLIRPTPARGMAAIGEDQDAAISAGRIAVDRAVGAINPGSEESVQKQEEISKCRRR